MSFATALIEQAFRSDLFLAKDTLAESVRRTADRLDSKRVPGHFRDPQREAYQANPEFLFRLLPRIEDSFRTGQAMSPCKAGLEGSEESSCSADAGGTRVASAVEEFWWCSHCDRIYWKESHYQRMQQLVSDFPRSDIVPRTRVP